jgi:HK97 gp10 family phage protein
VAKNDEQLSGFKEIDAMFQRLEQGPETDALQRKALRAAGAIIATELQSVTPIREDGGKGLAPGALKAAVRQRVSVPTDGSAPSAKVDFGKLTHIARLVDSGHINANSKVRTHTPAHPFVRAAEAASHAAAVEAYIETMKIGIAEILDK